MTTQGRTATNFDATKLNNSVVFSVSQMTDATVQAVNEYRSATGGTACVLTIERSNDGTNWFGLESATTLTVPNMTASFSVKGFLYLRARVTTADSVTTSKIKILLGVQNVNVAAAAFGNDGDMPVKGGKVLSLEG